MADRLFQLYYRLDILRMKLAGSVPQFSWGDMAFMMYTSSTYWPAEKLVTAQEESPDGITTFDTPIGKVAHNTSDARILGLLVLEEMRSIYEQGPVTVRTGDVVIDLGANVGTFTRFALNRGAAKVLAFEPEPRHIEILKQGFAQELAEGRVVIVEAGAWNEPTTLRFQSEGLVSRLDESGQISVPVVKVDDIVEEMNLDRVDFIKADIEGAERFAVLGAGNTLRRFGPRMALCIYHLPDDPEVIEANAQKFFSYSVETNSSGAQAFFSPKTA